MKTLAISLLFVALSSTAVQSLVAPQDKPQDVTDDPNLRLLPRENCAFSNSEDRIITNGHANAFDIPWMARLGYSRKGNEEVKFQCGASLISDRYVLTAAHCVKAIPNDQTLKVVRLGETDTMTDPDCFTTRGSSGKVCAPRVMDVGVEEVIVHPDFNLRGEKRMQNDIALIRLDRKVEFSDAVRPVCLPVGKEQSNDLLEGGKVMVAGFGATEEGSQSSSLNQVFLPVVAGARCVSAYKSHMVISPWRQMCAGGTGEGDSCQGDGGGPLTRPVRVANKVERNVQYGIVSLGQSECGGDIPGVYTRVGYYMKWILQNLEA